MGSGLFKNRMATPLKQRHSCSEPPRCLYNPAFSSSSHNLPYYLPSFLSFLTSCSSPSPSRPLFIPLLFPERFSVSSSRYYCFIPTCFLAISLRSFSLTPLLSHFWLFHMRAILTAAAIAYSHKIRILPGFHVIYICNPVFKCRPTSFSAAHDHPTLCSTRIHLALTQY